MRSSQPIVYLLLDSECFSRLLMRHQDVLRSNVIPLTCNARAGEAFAPRETPLWILPRTERVLTVLL